MTTVEVRVRYYAHDFWVPPSLLGWCHVFERQGHRVEVRFPANSKEFQAGEHERETAPTPSTFPVATVAEPGWDNSTVAVRLFCVAVQLVTQLAPNLPEDPFEGEYGRLAELLAQEGAQLARTVAQDFLRWVRASTRQPWLGLVADAPIQYGRAGLYYADDGVGVMGFGPDTTVKYRSSRLRLEPKRLEAMME